MPGPRKDCGTRGYQHSLIMVFEWRRVVRLKGVPAAFDEETAGQASISVCCRTSNANGSNAVTHLQVDIDRSFDCSPVHQKRETHLESSPNLNYVTQTSARNGKARAVKHSVQMDMTRKVECDCTQIPSLRQTLRKLQLSQASEQRRILHPMLILQKYI